MRFSEGIKYNHVVLKYNGVVPQMQSLCKVSRAKRGNLIGQIQVCLRVMLIATKSFRTNFAFCTMELVENRFGKVFVSLFGKCTALILERVSVYGL